MKTHEKLKELFSPAVSTISSSSLLFSPGLDVVEQMLPAVVDVLQLVVDLSLFRLVAGRDELFSELLQMGFILAEQVDLFHTVLMEKPQRDLLK